MFAAKLSQPGNYNVEVELLDGWRLFGRNGRCSIAKLSFVVSCADTYRQEGSSCKLDDSGANREMILGFCIGI